MTIRFVMLGIAAALVSAVPAMACDTISAKAVKISACIDGSWQAQEPGKDQDAFYYSDDGNIGFVLVGTQVSASVTDFRQAILDNALGKDTSVVGERVENIDGKPWNVIEYNTTVNDTVFLFTEYYYLAPGFGSAELIYWTIPDLATEAAFRAGQLMATVKLGS